MKCCPTCGRPILSFPWINGRERRKLVELLARFPDGITRADLASRIWEDDIDGGPDNTLAVCQLVHRARLQLKHHGYTIKSSRGPGAFYKLVRSW